MITIEQKTIYTVNDQDFDSLQHAKESFEWSITTAQRKISEIHNSLKWENAQYESLLRASKEDFERDSSVRYEGITISKPSVIKYLKKLKAKETIKQYTKRLKIVKQRYYSYISSLKEVEKRIKEEAENSVG